MRKIHPHWYIVFSSVFSILSFTLLSPQLETTYTITLDPHHGLLPSNVTFTQESQGNDSIVEPLVLPRKIVVSAKFGANGMYRSDAAFFRLHAIDSGAFHKQDIFAYYKYPRFILDNPKWSRHLQFLNHSSQHDIVVDEHPTVKGGGFWFWKPVIIDHHLKELKFGDFLFYQDVDVYQWGDFQRSEYIMNQMIRRNASLGLAVIPFIEQQWSLSLIHI